MSTSRSTLHGLAIVCGLAAATVATLVTVTPAVQAQDGGGDRLSCASVDGRRVSCEADTRNGVRLVREASDLRCQEGVSWGYTERAIWVDRGCRAEFEVFPPPDAAAQTIAAGTALVVRTTESIDVERGNDDRVFIGVVDENVRDVDGRGSIPRGSTVELMVRTVGDNDLILDLESVTANGVRYAVAADAERIDSGRSKGDQAGEFIGGGALFGTILGAIAGGGKGAAVGAVAGAAAGAAIMTRGRTVRVPAETLLTFRLDRPLTVEAVDPGATRDGRHYHGDVPR